MGESPANTSFHLRQLAKYGFVEEAEGGTGRRRPWKRVALGMRFTEVHDDPETAAAARELSRTMSHRYLARAEKGLEENRSLPDEWRKVTGWNQMGLYLTPDELETLDAEDPRADVRALRRAPRPHRGHAGGRRARGDPDLRLPDMKRAARPSRRPPVPDRPVAQPARRHRAVARARPVGEGAHGLQLRRRPGDPVHRRARPARRRSAGCSSTASRAAACCWSSTRSPR